MKLRFTKAPTFTKAIIAAAVFAVIYLASTSNLPSCSDIGATLASGGQCIERQSFLHTGSGWLSIISLIAAVVLLALKHKDSILGRPAPTQQASAQQESAREAYQNPPPQAGQWPPTPAPVPARAPGFCAKCGTRIIAGDRFCQGCGITVETH